MKKIIASFLVLTAVAIPALAGAASSSASGSELLPAPTIPNGFGVNIHFRGQPRDLDMIAKGGFKFVRMDLTWSSVEKTEGIYDFVRSGYDSLTAGCMKRGIRILYILDYSNTLYESDISVRTEVGRRAYADFAAAAAKRFAGRGILWEIWNEPNIKQFWRPEPNVADYCKLVEQAAPRIRKADPTGVVVAGATSQIPFEWLEDCFKAGLLKWIDVLSVHPYRSQQPETVVADYAKLRDLIDRYAPAGKEVPIISGEWGYSNINWDETPISEQQQAQYLARMFLLNCHQNVRVSIWYDWKNDGADPREREHQFGTVGKDLNPKAAYLAAKVLSAKLAGYSIDGRLDLGNENDYALKLSRGKAEALAFWTTGAEHNVELPLDPGEVTLTGMLGDEVVMNFKTALKIRAEQSPQYVFVHPRAE